jgi:hypothetical protein
MEEVIKFGEDSSNISSTANSIPIPNPRPNPNPHQNNDRHSPNSHSQSQSQSSTSKNHLNMNNNIDNAVAVAVEPQSPTISSLSTSSMPNSNTINNNNNNTYYEIEQMLFSPTFKPFVSFSRFILTIFVIVCIASCVYFGYELDQTIINIQNNFDNSYEPYDVCVTHGQTVERYIAELIFSEFLLLIIDY